jgi:outer membrane protein
MIKFFKILLFFSFSFFVNNSAYAESNIMYIDLDYIVSNSNPGKKLFEDLKNRENLKINELKEKEKELKNEENKILGSKNLISEDQLKIDIENFQKKLADYKTYNKNEIDKLQNKRNDEVKNLLNTINSIIETYMDENSISILLDKKNIYIAHKKYDITEKLIELINKNIK